MLTLNVNSASSTATPFHSPAHPSISHKMSPPRPPSTSSKTQPPGNFNPAAMPTFPFPTTPPTTTSNLTALTADLLTFKKDLDALRLRVKQLHALTTTPPLPTTPLPSHPQNPTPSTFQSDLLTFKSSLDKLRTRLKEVTALTIATTVATTIAATTQNSDPPLQESQIQNQGHATRLLAATTAHSPTLPEPQDQNQGPATRLLTTLLTELRALLHATLEKVVWLRAAQHRGGGVGGMGGGVGEGLFGLLGSSSVGAAVPGAERRASRPSGGGGGHSGSGRADPVQDVMDRLGVAMSGGPGHARSSGVGIGVGVGEQTSVPSVLTGLGKSAAVKGLRGMVERAGVGEFLSLFFRWFLDWSLGVSLWGAVLTWGIW